MFEYSNSTQMNRFISASPYLYSSTFNQTQAIYFDSAHFLPYNQIVFNDIICTDFTLHKRRIIYGIILTSQSLQKDHVDFFCSRYFGLFDYSI